MTDFLLVTAAFFHLFREDICKTKCNISQSEKEWGLAYTKLGGVQQRHLPFILFIWTITSFSVSLRSCCSLLRLNSSSFAVRSASSSVLNLDVTSLIWSVVSIKALSWNRKHNEFLFFYTMDGFWQINSMSFWSSWSDAQISFWAFEEKTAKLNLGNKLIDENKPIYCWLLFPSPASQRINQEWDQKPCGTVTNSCTALWPH